MSNRHFVWQGEKMVSKPTKYLKFQSKIKLLFNFSRNKWVSIYSKYPHIERKTYLFKFIIMSFNPIQTRLFLIQRF